MHGMKNLKAYTGMGILVLEQTPISLCLLWAFNFSCTIYHVSRKRLGTNSRFAILSPYLVPNQQMKQSPTFA